MVENKAKSHIILICVLFGFAIQTASTRKEVKKPTGILRVEDDSKNCQIRLHDCELYHSKDLFGLKGEKGIKGKSGVPKITFPIDRKKETHQYCIEIPQNVDMEELRKNHSITHEKSPFWFSTSGGRGFQDLYHYSEANINVLRRISWNVTQKIRYHCYNSKVVDFKDQSKSLQLLTWNEQMIGPKPSSDAHTRVPYYTTTHDGCRNSINKWNHTDIEVNGAFGRLPVIDFYIRDIRPKIEQKFYIEITELCFGEDSQTFRDYK